ncbi:hypothetical protein [Leucothrix pacifica]|uniref:Uncharacterized protein n=1 Tax=Leucothrix pacifica TaxID=1247513 RepID=A0A317CR00_9GAMM|nr:hypothetical protein [Leucothrix pacifica]PWQ98840.1 hypothetical protein DKW60_07290 [Leucothrix pacifica]
MTAQVHEVLIIDGQETSMAFCPPLPENDSRVIESKDDDGYISFSTDCWRQYVGTWEIKENKFYLINLDGNFQLADKTPIFADWFTGVLRVPQGNMMHYVHMEFGSVYECEMHIYIEGGIITKSKTIDNRNKELYQDEFS